MFQIQNMKFKTALQILMYNKGRNICVLTAYSSLLIKLHPVYILKFTFNL